MPERGKGGEVKHIFGGIEESLLNENLTPAENLEVLRAEFKRIGVNIGENVEIPNSSLRQLITRCNQLLRPMKDFDISPEEEEAEAFHPILIDPELRQLDNLRDAELVSKSKNLGIKIGAGTKIGENLSLDLLTSIGSDATVGNFVTIRQSSTIGDRTRVGDGVEIAYDCVVGDDCEIGNYTLLSNGVTLGNKVVTEESTILPKDMEVSAGSKVVRKGGPDDSQVGVEVKKTRHLKLTE